MALTDGDMKRIEGLMRGTIRAEVPPIVAEQVRPIVEEIVGEVVERVVTRESENLAIMIQAQFADRGERFDRLEAKFERMANAAR